MPQNMEGGNTVARYNKMDLYYGAFLYALASNLNGCVNKLFLVEKDGESSHRRFQISTNNGDYEVYCKYSTAPANSKNDYTWKFPFTKNETDELKTIIDEEKNLTLALICVSKEKDGKTPKIQEIAIVNKEDTLKCYCFNSDPSNVIVESSYNKDYLNITRPNWSTAIRVKRKGIELL
jgi:hypothetical protein